MSQTQPVSPIFTDAFRNAAGELARFCQAVHSNFPILRRTLASYISELYPRPGYLVQAERLMGLALQLSERIGLSYDDLLGAYAEFCIAHLREQDEFLKTGEFRNASKGFEEVRLEVYENDEYMKSYMLGHLLTCAVFPHHFEQYQFFMNRFVPSLPANATVCEFGVGHGLWITSFLAHSAGRRGFGCDISPTSLMLAQHMAEIRGIGADRINLVLADAVKHDLSGKVYDAAIASGVLEHIEDPEGFLKKIRSNLTPHTGRLFTMVPTNTALPDHLILFNEIAEIQAMYQRAGMFLDAEEVSSARAPANDDGRIPEVHVGIFGRAA
jgi:2-polyprenyl-3-methyl-5-hydroxy-6-metoxy-1,4-benzoquinol methylase